MLILIVRAGSIARTGCAPEEQPAACSDGCSCAHIAGGTTNGCTCSSSQDRADSSAGDCRVLSGLLTGYASHLLECVLTADSIVCTELFKALARARKGHDAGSRGKCRAGRECSHKNKQREYEQSTHDITSLARTKALPALSASRPGIP